MNYLLVAAAVAGGVFVALYLSGLIGKGKKETESETGVPVRGVGVLRMLMSVCPALHEREYRKFTLANKRDVSPNTTVFRFNLQVRPLRPRADAQKNSQLCPKHVRFAFVDPLRLGLVSVGQSPNGRLGLPVGNHIMLKFNDQDGKQVFRPYTPGTRRRILKPTPHRLTTHNTHTHTHTHTYAHCSIIR